VVALVYGVIIAIITTAQWVGWVTIPTVALIAVLIGVPAGLAKHRDAVNANVLRKCLNADRRVRLGRRSVIAGAQAS